jgi:hypothetical protein
VASRSVPFVERSVSRVCAESSVRAGHLEGEAFEDKCTKAVQSIVERQLLQQVARPLIGFEQYLAKRPRARPLF